MRGQLPRRPAGSRLRRTAIPVSLATLLVIACTTPRSVISTGAYGLRTFSVIRPDGAPVACSAFGLVNPVIGTLEGNPSFSSETVWLQAPDGRRLSVVWPGGFSVRFEPSAAIYNEKGTVVARAGQRVALAQTRPETAAGGIAPRDTRPTTRGHVTACAEGVRSMHRTPVSAAGGVRT